MGMATRDERIRRMVAEEIALVPYDATWPAQFAAEEVHLRGCLPAVLLGRIEHVGSTAIPGLLAKPVIDLLIEVHDLTATRETIAPLLEAQGYDYLWRPTLGSDPPWYAWFVKRDAAGRRTHHLHCVEPHYPQWQWLVFRDYLRAHPEAAAEYATLKLRLAAEHAHDREAYTRGKSAFCQRILALVQG
jgi:GrpB-like predicted nucleotidyltransferase (UPF0157 family)